MVPLLLLLLLIMIIIIIITIPTNPNIDNFKLINLMADGKLLETPSQTYLS